MISNQLKSTLMDSPNFADLYKMYRYIAQSAFGTELTSEYKITQTFHEGKPHYHVIYQGVTLHTFSHLTDVFSFLYLKDIERKNVYLEL